MPISIINPFMTSASPEAEVTEVIAVADVDASLNGKYFLIRDVAGSVSVTMRTGRTEATEIDFAGINAAALDTGTGNYAKYIVLESGSGTFAFWFNVEGTLVDPGVGGATAVEVALIASNNDAAVAAAFLAEAVSRGFADNGSAGTVAAIVTSAQGNYANPSDGLTGAALSVTTEGITPGANPGTAARNIFVTFALNDTDVAIATAIESALNTDGAWTVSRATATLTVTDAATGARVDAADVDTGFTISVTTQGA